MYRRDLQQRLLEKRFLDRPLYCDAWARPPKAHPQKVSWVKNAWMISGVFMLFFPSLAMISAITLFTAFVSFSILDETP